LVAKELGDVPDYTVLKKWMLEMISHFDKTVFESYGMLYQNEFDYYFDSTKFNYFFNYKPKPYNEGIKETIEFLNAKLLSEYHLIRYSIRGA
jgi:hypothetical protein